MRIIIILLSTLLFGCATNSYEVKVDSLASGRTGSYYYIVSSTPGLPTSDLTFQRMADTLERELNRYKYHRVSPDMAEFVLFMDVRVSEPHSSISADKQGIYERTRYTRSMVFIGSPVKNGQILPVQSFKTVVISHGSDGGLQKFFESVLPAVSQFIGTNHTEILNIPQK